jgi:hypothetical protein
MTKFPTIRGRQPVVILPSPVPIEILK